MTSPTSDRYATAARTAHPSLGFHWLMLLCASWMIVGLFLDGWAHIHVPGLETFFTPWHAVLYSGMVAAGACLAAAFASSIRRGRQWRHALPEGYLPSLAGVVVFGASGVGDMLWHEAFGVEESIDALLSPTHLGLAIGFVLILAGPLRAARRTLAPDAPPAWRTHLPAVLCTSYVLAVFGFFTQYAHPVVEPLAGVDAPASAAVGELYLHRIGTNIHSRVLTGVDRDHGRPAVSPDGRTIAFTAGRDGAHELYLMNADGTGVRRLTQTPAGEAHPAWSPDGSRLAFISAEGHFGDLRVLDLRADGGHVLAQGPEGEHLLAQAPHDVPLPAQEPDAVRVLTQGRVDVFGTLSWSPDGSQIMFTGMQDGRHRLFTVAANARDAIEPDRLIATPITAEEAQGSWSPDGRRVLFTALEGGNADIYVVDASEPSDRSRATRLTDAPSTDYFPAWLPGGEAVAFTSREGGTANVFVLELASGARRNVTPGHGMQNWQATWAPDGTWMAYVGAPGGPASGAGLSGSELTQALGIVSMLLQTAVLLSGALALLRAWRLPLGSMTVLFGAHAALFGFMSGRPEMAVATLLAGLTADGWLWAWGKQRAAATEFASAPHAAAAPSQSPADRSPARPPEPYPRLLPVAVPVAWAALYFLTLELAGGVAWPVELWAGTIVLSGATGWLVGYLLGWSVFGGYGEALGTANG